MSEKHFHGKSHGRLHIDEDAPVVKAKVICACGSIVEAQPMKPGVCYDCFREEIAATAEYSPLMRCIEGRLGKHIARSCHVSDEYEPTEPTDWLYRE